MIDVYEDNFYGIAASDLRSLQRTIRDRLIVEHKNLQLLFRILQRISDGRREFLWVPLLAQLEIGAYLRERHHTSPILKESIRLYKGIIVGPRKRLRQNHAGAKAAWAAGRRTLWDEEIGKRLHPKSTKTLIDSARNNVLLYGQY